MSIISENVIVVYGASDDLVEICGDVNDEIDTGEPVQVRVTVDGVKYARLWIGYDIDGSGQWRIYEPQRLAPAATVTLIAARGDEQGDDDDGCPGYSDKAIIGLPDQYERVKVKVKRS